MSIKLTPKQFEDRVRLVWGDKVKIVTPYIKSSEKVLVHYNECGHEDLKIPHKLLNGQGCSQCRFKHLSESKTKTTEQYIQNLADKKRNVILLSEYKGVKEQVTIKNLDCGHIYNACANNILQGSGCPICHGMKDTNKFTEQLNELYPGEYIVLGNYVNNRTRILIRHKCGYEWYVIPKDILRKFRCPECNRSYGEKLVGEILNQLQIPFKKECSFPNLSDKKKLRFDFVCSYNNQTYAIEVDGEQHYKEKNHLNDRKGFHYLHNHDLMKNDYCKNNSIKLLRIPYNWINQTGKIEAEIRSFFNIKL